MDSTQAEGGAAAAPPAQPTEQTSRIIVKNLPKYVDENRLREHFSAKGEVTDAKVMRTRDGKSRLFGFIGFSSAAEAEAAVNYFNKTFLDASRLEVQFAFKYGASEKPRAWSKYTEGTTAHRRSVEGTGANAVAVAGKDEKKKKKTKELKPEEVDPKLREFMALMQPRAKQAIWANDDVGMMEGSAVIPNGTGNDTVGKDVVLEDGDGSDDELYEDIPQGRKNESDDDDNEEESEQGDEGAEKKKALDPVVADAGLSDMDYLRSRMRKNFDEEEQNEESDKSDGSEMEEEESEEEGDDKIDGLDGSDEEDEGEEQDNDLDAIFKGDKKMKGSDADAGNEDEEAPASPSRRGKDDPASVIAETGRLFVRNLPYTATEEDLKTTFAPFGALGEVHLVLDRTTRKSKGYALVQYARAEDAVSAHAALDGSIFMGRLMHILPGMRAPAVATEDAEGDENGQEQLKGGTSSYKRQKEADLKASAGNKVAWNSLFMRADTVAEAVAAHYGVSKADLLDPNAPDMAVRMALGETQVIAETKTALAKAGVDVDALENAAAAAGKGTGAKVSASGIARSDCTLLVKNLPYSADEGELEGMFSALGPVLRIVLPPTKTLALVEYAEPQDARKAFKTLAYKRYQSVPIYLEWAPKATFSGPPQAATTTGKAAAAEKKKETDDTTTNNDLGKAPGKSTAAVPTARPEDVAAGLAAAAAGGDDSIDSTTIYVKNLSFKTEEPGLQKHFAAAVKKAGGELRAVKIAKKKTKDGRMLSSGFGFVECSSESVARDVIVALQGSSLDGHRLVLQLSQGAGGKAEGAGKKGSGAAAPPSKGATKIVVRNLAFEASRKDMMGLFTPFGAVKSCRLPRKFDGSHRGFAFVEFATPQEARSAVEAVSGTHLYGRRLVIEWAEDEGGLDELRVKTASKFRGDEAALMAGEKRSAGEEEEAEQAAGGKKRRKRG